MITAEEIKHLAKLARIEVSPEEEEKMASEIDSILGYVSQVQAMKADTEANLPNLRNVMREDMPTNTPGQYTDKILANAPSREGNYLKVKKIL